MATKRFTILLCSALLICLFSLGSGRAFAATHTLTVDDDHAQCPNADFTSIQAAVTAASPGDQIKVCAGVYNEQVLIPAAKSGLTLFSVGHWAATIKAPPVMTDPGDIVRVNGAQNVTLRDFVISGPLPDSLFCSTFTRTGVRVDGGGSANVLGNHITQIWSTNPLLRGCQNGVAVLMGRNFEGQVGSGTVKDNLIDMYQKGAVVVDNAGSSGVIQHNTIQGGGVDPNIARNGIQVSRGATGSVQNNDISGNVYSHDPEGSGIILYQLQGGVDVSANNVYTNDYGILLEDTSQISASHNQVTSNVADGIAAFEGADSNSVEHNQITSNGGNGIGLYDTTNNTVGHNDSDNNAQAGIYAESDSANNHIDNNHMQQNSVFDAEDDSVGPGTAGTANFWTHNHCDTQSRPGLCGK